MKFSLSIIISFVFLLSDSLCANLPPPSATDHSITINGKQISYKAVAGTLRLHNEAGKATADIFYVAYQQPQGKSQRPITFCFDGGPGNASVWLHLGGIGPKQINTGDAAQKYKDNPYTLLDVTDLVFIDPISAGFSRPVKDVEAKTFYNSKEDTKLLADFIRVYLTQNSLWGVPKYIIGQDFGGYRACDIAYHLYEENFIFLNGIILLSSTLNYQTISDPDEGNDLPYALALPTYAATYSFHNKQGSKLDQKDIEAFVLDTYNQALFLGNNLAIEKAQDIAAGISRFTGIPVDYILRGNLKVAPIEFSNVLLRMQQKFLSLYDTRTLTSLEIGRFDPLCPQLTDTDLTAAMASAINTYLAQELKYKSQEEYVIQANVCPWSYAHNKNQFPVVSDRLKFILNKNPQLKLFSASGYYDLIAPYFAINYTLSHLGLDPTVQKRVSTKTYPSGHYISLDEVSQVQLKNDLTQFYLQGSK